MPFNKEAKPNQQWLWKFCLLWTLGKICDWNFLQLYFWCQLYIRYFCFLLSSHVNLKKKRSLHRIYTLLIQYLYTNKILWSNSSDNSQKYPLNLFFLPFFLKSSNSKIYYSNWLVDFIFWNLSWNIKKKKSIIIGNSINYFESFNLITSRSSF